MKREEKAQGPKQAWLRPHETIHQSPLGCDQEILAAFSPTRIKIDDTQKCKCYLG